MSLSHALRRAIPLALILSLALALRLWYVTTLPGQGVDLIFSDMSTYDYTAWCMVRGLPVTGEPGLNGYHPLSASTYYYPGYTYFLAAVYAAAGHERAVVRIVQAAVGTATVGLVYLVGYLTFGHRPGLVAALLTAIYLPLVYYAGLLLTETWFIFLEMTAVALWLLAWMSGLRSGAEAPEAGSIGGSGLAHPGRRTGAGTGLVLAVAAGLATGMACLTRPAFLPALGTLVVGGWLFPPAPASRARRATLLVAFLLGAGGAIAPITVRNFQIHGRFILISTNGPSTFLTGHVTHNAPLPGGLPPGTTDAEMAGRHLDLSLRYLRVNWRTYLDEIPEFFRIIWTEDDFWPSTSTYWSRSRDPARARTEVHVRPAGSPPYGHASYFPDLIRYVDRSVWCLIGLPMGLLAVLFLPRGHRRWVPLYLALAPYVLIPFIAFPFPRFRMPAVPLVFLLAGQSIVACRELRRRLD